MMKNIERLKQAWTSTPADHRQSLLGERRTGSKWGRPFTLEDWYALLARWEVFEPEAGIAMPGCTYLRASILHLFPLASLGAIAWEMLDASERERVVVHAGAHGPELGLLVESGTRAPGATTATLILGPNAGAEVVYTVHPGDPLRPGLERAGLSAVKLVPR